MTDQMMPQESVDTRQSMHHRVLIAAFIVFAQDLNSRGGVQAWTYNYSNSPNRRWFDANQWCKQHFTGMVAIENQEENDFINNLLQFHPKYYWIGVRKVDIGWVWDRSGEKVPEENQNWAPGEPDNLSGQDCVEMYIKRDKDTAKWNNENCRKKKGTICYSASCRQDSCSIHADCVETIGNYTCQCHPGFLGLHCEEAIECKPLLHPEQGSHNCFYPYGSNRFNSSCHFHCELGFQLVGAPQLLCQASGHWNHPVPLCQVKKCSPIFFPVTGNMTCVDALEPFSFRSQCNFTCQEGFYLSGDDALICLASGQWDKPTPTCKVVQCNSLKAPPHVSMQCQDPLGVYSYGSTCALQCEEGFKLIGANMTKCSSLGNWSHALPVCQAKRCDPINSTHGSMSCFDPNGSFSFGSRCTTTCDEGFVLNGTASTECNSMGMWSADIPSCLAKRCPTLSSPSHGSLACSDPHAEFSFGSHCTSICEEGFILNGTADTDCTSLGTWSTDIPRCLAKRCPTLNSTSHGSLSCSDPHEAFSFGSRCTSTCEEGFVLNGIADTECTSESQWSTDIPRCLAKRCPTLNVSSHSTLACSNPHGEFSFGSECTSTCMEGFILNGTPDTQCTSLGMWSREIPHCLAHPCPLLAKPPQHGRMNCGHPYSPFSYGSHCDIECNKGFRLRGTSSMTCNNSGHWSQDLPTCQPIQCEAIHGMYLPLFVNCSHPLGNFSFGSKCLFTCGEGFSLNGTEVLYCSSTGFWSDRLPNCTVNGMPLGTAMLMYAGVGAASVVVPLALIGLALLIMTRFKKKGNKVRSDAPAWGARENPAFEF
uniref:Selectin P n=1 Tax=Dicentrarchus labrax TaxID=13489 RepID=A0A8C4DKH8_DICLA